MKFIPSLMVLLVGAAVAHPLQHRQENECAVYDECFHYPLPCPSNSVCICCSFWIHTLMLM
ncbi:hypothetical protein CCMA1212_003999 [Trichoderma ghanense]|uniref:SSCRP protein n=1 Tax=Trichoderma ghanense TaxID=65468 RepID=A0ABY2H8B3_9HYPO